MHTIAIVGRPNVGKSTLFNRLVGKNLALVDSISGLTRDRQYGRARLADLSFHLIDTPGWQISSDHGGEGMLDDTLHEQTLQAVEDSDFVLLVVDGRDGRTGLDDIFLDILRRCNRPFVTIVNKCEGRLGLDNIDDFWPIGGQSIIPFSAAHGDGLSALYDALSPHLDGDNQRDDNENAPLRLTIIGRPNVGKSTIINRLLGSNRLATAPLAGVTRDSVLVPWHHRGRDYTLVDTAGLRRKGRGRLERLSMEKTIQAIRLTQVACLVLDSQHLIERQDRAILGHIMDEGRAPLIIINKCDRHPLQEWSAIIRSCRGQLRQAEGVDILACSALDGSKVNRIPNLATRAAQAWDRRIATSVLNQWMHKHLSQHPPPYMGSRRLKIRYVTQVSTRPPHFTFFANAQKQVPKSYIRYLQNSLRRYFSFAGAPIRISVRKISRGEDHGADG